MAGRHHPDVAERRYNSDTGALRCLLAAPNGRNSQDIMFAVCRGNCCKVNAVEFGLVLGRNIELDP